MMKNAVSCRDVVVVRGAREVLHGVGFDLRTGTVTGLLGPSGCGKTTLIRAIVGLQAKVTGDISVLGLPAGAPKLRGRIGYVTQEPSVYLDLSVVENLRFFAAVQGVPAGDVDRVIDAVDLRSHAHERVDRLSGGQQSRASLARNCSSSTNRPSASIRSCGGTCGSSSMNSPTPARRCSSPVT
jgi:ABC-2 type transport system ATP-binding protein